MSVLAVDLGGTVVKCGLVAGGSLRARRSIPARSQGTLAQELPQVAEAFAELRDISDEPCSALALAFPGLVDARAGRVLSAPRNKYHDAAELDLGAWSREALGLNLTIENDAHAALLGEWRHGAGRGCEDLVVLTLGTGVGSSVLLRGRPLRGRHHQAGVLGGHFIVRPGGRACSCPAHGCVEAETGSWALPAIAAEQPDFADSALARAPRIDYEAVFRLAEDGDACALRLRDRALHYWGAAAISLVHAYDPERLVVGGGVMGSAESILPALQAALDEEAWTPSARVTVHAAELGDDAALLGMAALATEKVELL